MSTLLRSFRKPPRLVMGMLAGATIALFVFFKPVESADRASSASRAVVEPNGTIQVPAFELPMSQFASEQAKKDLTKILREGWASGSAQKTLQRMRELYAVRVEERTIGGVHAFWVTAATERTRAINDRVLINVHGGGLDAGGANPEGLIEAIPVASLSKIDVITLDYRRGPQHRFPAASEDVTAVYRELLKTYSPKSIGIYGCSAGGVVTAQATAWIVHQKLPTPGAIGIFCGAASGWLGGDSGYLTDAFGGSPRKTAVPLSDHAAMGNAAYVSNADFSDPLVVPIRSNAVLARFPPALLINGTRDWSLSAALHTHIQLVKAGVEAELYVWDGLWHGFLSDPDLPESQEAYAVIAKFFDRHLIKKS